MFTFEFLFTRRNIDIFSSRARAHDIDDDDDSAVWLSCDVILTTTESDLACASRCYFQRESPTYRENLF